MSKKEEFLKLVEEGRQIWKMIAEHCYTSDLGEAELLARANEINERLYELAMELEDPHET